ncbi:zinc-binding dehydrogenase [Xylocopilactobacillus apis]|uniref:Oxidoreductase n=1 Tax=Xylocopilactobacillus apis TaxID=2932183 RepID=A0AAU9D3G6_9LACO|nr:zinc-binding dehydrogenase [Xylocopilactobacillus apis]BDR57086.1 oxidoreductase [Xylocopilactobacillus apis]
MKAVVIYEAGGPENLIYQDVHTPELKPGWSLVKVKGFGVNHSELFTRQGKSPTVKFPKILGIECVGLIAKSTDVRRLPIGTKVISLMGEMGRDFNGSYAEYVLLPNNQIYPIETRLSWEKLATLPETYYTAFGSLNNLKIEEDDRVLVRGATSGVGIAFINLLKSKFSQLKVDGTSRSFKKEQLLNVGYNHVILDQEGELQTDRSYDKILELVGPATIKDSFCHLNEGGILCSTGQLGGQWYLDNFDPIMDLKSNSYLTSFYSGNVSAEKINQLLTYVSDYRVKLKPEKIFSLKDIRKAHEYLEGHHSFGKVIVLFK